MSSWARVALGMLGGLIYEATGFVVGSQNAGWFDLGRDANALFPGLGVGATLVVVAFSKSRLNRDLKNAASLGRTTRALLVLGPLAYILSWVIEFAIIGTLVLGAGLIGLAFAVSRRKLVPTTDRVLIIMSAVGSVTWNTETVSAFLLVGVGVIWIVLSARLLPDPTHH